MDSGNESKQVDKRKAPETSDSTDCSLGSGMKKPRLELRRLESSDGPSNSIREGNGSVLIPGVGEAGTMQLDENTNCVINKENPTPAENNTNDTFFTEIKKREEMHRSENSIMDEDCPETEEIEKSTGTRKRGKASATRASIESQEEVSISGPLKVTMKIYDEARHRTIVDQITFQTDAERVQKFLQQHGQDLNTIHASGYSADISSQENSDKPSGRISWNSLGSTIPRQSVVSISSGPTQLGNVIKPPMSVPSGKGRKRLINDREPIVASTKIDDLMEMDESDTNKRDINLNNLSNGGDHSNGSSPKIKSAKDKSSPIPNTTTNSQSSDEKPQTVKRGRGRPPKYPKKDVTPDQTTQASSILPSKRGSSSAETSNTSFEDKATPLKSTGAPRGRPPKVKVNITPAATIQSSSGGRITVTKESNLPGTSTTPSKTISFDVELLSDDEKDALMTSKTLWGTVGVGEPVFARWRDKSYYSGVVTAKGHNDTWHIQFEDGLEDVASESHIVPVRIIGVGVHGIYSPDGVFSPHKAVVIGHRFAKIDDDDVVQQAQSVMYAIKCDEFSRPIWCTRRQITIGENEAKELRKEFNPSAIVAKAADINLDNVVKGSRIRSSGVKIVGGAFDSSSADEGLLSSLTPLRRFGTPQLSIKEDSILESPVPVPSTSRLSDRVASTSTPSTSTAQDSTPAEPAEKPAPKRPGRPRKQMFDGMQFFLTASGGGDPSQDETVIIPYDKIELKDTIEKNGGKVIDAVSKEKGTTNIYLISDSHARTVKYIYCLAGGIPCVSYTWIKMCAEKSQLQDWKEYQLMSGYSLEQESVIPRHSQKPLKGMKIYVTAESDELYNYWKPVLTVAQAILLNPNKKTLAIPPEAEVLVTDSTCATNLLNTANKNLIPIVKPEWLVQTIITGTKADFFGHERYRVPNGELENADEENDPPE